MPDLSTSSSPPSETPGAAERVEHLALGGIGVVVFSDILCPWAHIGMFRLRRAIHDRGLDDELTIDHRAFPLESVGGQVHEREHFDAMVTSLREVEPDAGWSTWRGDADFPTSSLLALEAVQAAKAVSPQASAALDQALRRAVWAQSRPIDQLDTVVAVATEIDGLDLDTFRDELDSGRARREIEDQTVCARRDEIPASPTIVLPDGTTAVNPGIEMHMGDDGVPVVDADDPDAYGHLVEATLEQRTYD